MMASEFRSRCWKLWVTPCYARSVNKGQRRSAEMDDMGAGIDIDLYLRPESGYRDDFGIDTDTDTDAST